MVVAPDCLELDDNTIVIGVDKDRHSQQAVKWTIDHFLKGKIMPIVLVHVKLHPSQPRDENVCRSPSEFESQQIYLSYRGFLARKGIDAREVVLDNIDVTTALIGFINAYSIGTLIVGASTRNSFIKKFKHSDVPSRLLKSAPKFCAVYVILRGKLHLMRHAIQSTCSNSPNSSEPTSPKSIASSTSSSSSFWTSSLRSSTRSSSCSSNSSISSIFSRIASMYNTPRTSTPTCLDRDDVMSESTQSLSIDSPASRNDCSREIKLESLMSEDFEINPCNQSNNGLRIQPRDVRLCRLQNLKYGRISLLDDTSHSSYNGIKSRGIVEDEYTESTNSQILTSKSIEEKLEDEISRLRIEIKNAMELYQSISDQASTANQKAKYLQRKSLDEEHISDEVSIMRDAVEVVEDLERLKFNTAMDVAQLSENLEEMETKRRKISEQREKCGQRVTTTNMIDYMIYSIEEIKAATNNFSDTQKVGEGGYGPVYKAIFQNTTVAIKVLRHDVSQGTKQFQKEIEVLRRMRHPNMVVLLGACDEEGCLVYEYMEKGSLEDRLFCKDNTPSIPWKYRFKIASEIASALLFLHQAKPEPMVHRDLKPANILLGENYVSKISDVGLARLIPTSSSNHMTAAAGTFCYIDPEYQQTGLLGTKSDVYSLGVLLLQLLTARPPMALAYNVEEAIKIGHFPNILDPFIRDWPIAQALSLAKLALKCCELQKKHRPSLDTVVLPELIRLRNFAMNF